MLYSYKAWAQITPIFFCSFLAQASHIHNLSHLLNTDSVLPFVRPEKIRFIFDTSLSLTNLHSVDPLNGSLGSTFKIYPESYTFLPVPMKPSWPQPPHPSQPPPIGMLLHLPPLPPMLTQHPEGCVNILKFVTSGSPSVLNPQQGTANTIMEPSLSVTSGHI